jgi:hypothetical protein
MLENKQTIADLTLRDCWKITKGSFWSVIVFIICCGLAFIFGWGFTNEVPTPKSGFWSEIPAWVKFSSIILVALLFIRSATSQIMEELGQWLIDTGSWIKEASLKKRIFMSIIISCSIVLLTFNWLIYAGFLILISSLGEEYNKTSRERSIPR